MAGYKFSHRGGKSKKSSAAVSAGPEHGNNSDWLDTVCNHASNTMCPVPNSLPASAFEKDEQNPDMLDHVFEGMERNLSFSKPPPTQQVLGQEEKSQSNISGLTGAEDSLAKDPKQEEDKDALDLVFEKVESFACGVPMGGGGDEKPSNDLKKPKSMSKKRSVKFEYDDSHPMAMDIASTKANRTWWIWAIIATLLVIAIICFGLVLIMGS